MFRSLDAVAYGAVEQVSPNIRRVIAENPSKFTYRGTGTYIVGDGEVVVIDPGPQLDSHRDALASALNGERVVAILVTHCHADHSPLAAWLHAETGAATFAAGPHPAPDPEWEQLGRLDPDEWPSGDDAVEAVDGAASAGEPKLEEATDYGFTPGERVADGDIVFDVGGLTMRAVATPGHTSNHICWSLESGSTDERALFTGDHVMGWSTTVVSPPDGDMSAYIDSLRKVAGRRVETLWPTHGPPRDDGAEYVAALVEHRLERERGVLAAVRAGHSSIRSIVALLYADVRPELHKAAARSVWGHLIKLVDEGQVQVEGLTKPGIRSVYRA
jgi:glyoxylase-like metal-dependent hydrolase (beta-lactamase superfamily II)